MYFIYVFWVSSKSKVDRVLFQCCFVVNFYRVGGQGADSFGALDIINHQPLFAPRLTVFRKRETAKTFLKITVRTSLFHHTHTHQNKKKTPNACFLFFKQTNRLQSNSFSIHFISLFLLRKDVLHLQQRRRSFIINFETTFSVLLPWMRAPLDYRNGNTKHYLIPLETERKRNNHV